MKNVKLLLGLFATAAIFSSCGSDDDASGPATNGALEGKWTYAKQGVMSGNNEVLFDYQNDAECTTKDYVEYVAGGVLKDVDYYDTDCKSDTYTSSWTKSGNTLTEGTGEDAIVYTIKELSSTTLKVIDVEVVQGVTVTSVSVYTRQ